jgi:hypothetical protein
MRLTTLLLVLSLLCAVLGMGCMRESAATKPAPGTNVGPQVHAKEGGAKVPPAVPPPPEIKQ